MIRVGFGYDSHRLEEKRKLVLGGVEIPHEKGLLGHSDADVLAHAVGDAILGAVGAEDLGTHFPETDPAFKNISSMAILARISEILLSRHYVINNVDVTVICEKPRLREYIPRMKAKVEDVLSLTPGSVSIKATTNERMGFIGRGEGIAACAVVTVYPVPEPQDT